MPAVRLPENRLRRLGLLVAFWTAVGSFIASHYYVLHLTRGFPFRWDMALGSGASALPWIPLTPTVVALARRFPVEGARWRRHLAVHVASALALNAATVVAVITTGRLFALDVFGAQMPLASAFVSSFLNNFFFHHLIYAAIVALVHAQRYYRSSVGYERALREREVRAAQLEGRLASAQLQALRMQLNPHFLFNTLHAVSSLVSQDARRARRMIADLSELLRLSLDRAGENEVSLDEELGFLRLYLQIEQTRFQDRLTVVVDVDDAVREALVPNLILQPLVENAVKHGIAPFDAGGTVRVAAARQGDAAGDRLVLRIEDTGPGLQAAAGTKGTGIGLRNTRERLAGLYGADGTLALTDRPDGGLAVTVSLPYRTLTG